MQNVITFSWSSWSLLAFSHTMSTFCRSTDASIYWRQSCSSRESLKFKASLYTSIISNTSCTWPEITRERNAGAHRTKRNFSLSISFYISLSIRNGRMVSDWSIFMKKKNPLLVRQNLNRYYKRSFKIEARKSHPKRFFGQRFCDNLDHNFLKPSKKKWSL